MTIRCLPRWPALLLFGALALYAAPLPADAPVSAEQRAATSEARLKKDIYFLASDQCEGRGPTTKGINLAADYIADQFKKAGLEPGGVENTYFQPFTISGAVQEAPAVLTLKGPKGEEIELKEGEQFFPLAIGGKGKEAGVGVVFAGYGAAVSTLKYDDYAGIDVEDKVVIVLRDVPHTKNKESPRFHGKPAALTANYNAPNGPRRRPSSTSTTPTSSRTGDDLLDFNYLAALNQGNGRIPAFHLKRAVLEKMLKASDNKDLSAIEAAIDKDMKPQSVELKGWTISFELKMHRDKEAIHLKNVVGVLEGHGPLAKETVVIGAHYDHLGYGGVGGSMAVMRDGLKKMAIHHGADDNGSGTTIDHGTGAALRGHERSPGSPSGVHDLQRRGAWSARLRLLLQASAVSAGRHGRHVQPRHGRPTAHGGKKKDLLLVEGSTTSKTFDALVDNLNKTYGFQMKKSDKFIPNSDHASFYRKKIPVLFLWTDIHDDYHKPSDTADKINIPGMRKIVDMSEEIVQHFATVTDRPDYVAGKLGGRGSGGNGPRLGIQPTYPEDEKGVLLSGVADGGPAAKAGLKGGDRIVEMAGKPVKKLEDYMEVMSTQKAGNTLDVVIERDGKKTTVKVKLE